ncbi:CBS domain-containing protein [Nonomuraea muscovyensis]|uniref:CBS domain-containing protein n=1 Tax=Nonomuraea muscovyensis TaxID=1124761 RepID=A0A7X0EZM6_9ACTN|nr:CBS domain-containing protein [Nonomuraea muscovyensis]MBB6349983.1 CBS domain-containing protein [Nonomuraea muscovyensis]
MRVTVNSVMTREVASVNGSTPFKDIAEILIAHAVSAVPVVDAEGHVIGVVSEADLLRKEEFREQFYREGYQPPLRARLRDRVGHRGRNKAAGSTAVGNTAAELMAAPAVTTTPDATTVEAARLMEEHGVKRLPIVDDDGILLGIVSRRDLLKVFVRQDGDIAREVREEVLDQGLWVDTDDVRVRVGNGVVTLSGSVNRHSDAELAVRMTQHVNGVVDVIDKLQWEEDDMPGWHGR